MRLVDDNQYDDVVKDSNNIIVQLSANWSGPCKILTPILESVASENGIDIVKVHVEYNPFIVARYDVRSIPRLLFIKDGEVALDLSGNPSLRKIKESCKRVYGC